jgi:hypothetical protein
MRKGGKRAELRGTAGKKNRGLQEEKTGGEKGRTAGTERRDSGKKKERQRRVTDQLCHCLHPCKKIKE